MAAIQYGEPDSGGDYPYSLASPRPSPADRFWEFVPDVGLVGPRRTALGDATQHQFRFRRDYTGRFSIYHLSPDEHTAMLGCKEWLLGGGAVRVVTDDINAAVYVCTLRPGTEPEIEKDDEARQFYKFRCDLRSSTPITVDYR